MASVKKNILNKLTLILILIFYFKFAVMTSALFSLHRLKRICTGTTKQENIFRNRLIGFSRAS